MRSGLDLDSDFRYGFGFLSVALDSWSGCFDLLTLCIRIGGSLARFY